MNLTDVMPLAQAIVAAYRSRAPNGFDPQNTGVALAVGVTAVAVGAAASAYSASQQADSEKQAQETNRINAMNTNQLNYEMFQQSRGSQGSAILPTYLKSESGSPFEEQLGENAVAAYTASQNPNAFVQDQAIVAAAQPSVAGANATAAGVFSGALVNEALGNEAQLAGVRQQGVTATKQAGFESLQQTLNDINDIQVGKGYSGDSYGNRMLKANASRSFATTAAANQAAANTQTAAEQYGIKQTGIQTRLANLSLPATMAQQDININNLPYSAATEQEKQRQSVMGMFNIGTSRYQYQPLPTVQPIASTGQIVGQAVGQAASSVGGATANYYAGQQQRQNNMDMINAWRAQPEPSTLPNGGYAQAPPEDWT